MVHVSIQRRDQLENRHCQCIAVVTVTCKRALCFAMLRLVGFKVIIVCLLGLVVVTSCMYFVEIMCSIDRDESKELLSKVDFIISALQDVLGPPVNGSLCRMPFQKYSSAFSVPMNNVFKNNLEPYKKKYWSVAPRALSNTELKYFESIYVYQLYHHLAMKLKFVHTICETGMLPLL